MTAPDWPALGRRALAAGFRWAPGVRDTFGDRLVETRDGSRFPYPYDADWGKPDDAHPPDFRDAATLGVLVAQVRERWGRPKLYARPIISGFWVVMTGEVDDGHLLPYGVTGASEAEAWVAALEAAKGGER